MTQERKGEVCNVKLKITLVTSAIPTFFNSLRTDFPSQKKTTCIRVEFGTLLFLPNSQGLMVLITEPGEEAT